MRAIPTLALPAALFLSLAASPIVSAQIQMPLGEYPGRLPGKLAAPLPDGSTPAFAFQGVVTLESQEGAAFTGTGRFEQEKQGVVYSLDLALSGSVDDAGMLQGTYSQEIAGALAASGEGVVATAGSGTFTGRFRPLGPLTLALAPGAVAGTENAPPSTPIAGKFLGKGPLGPFAADAARVREAAKLMTGILRKHAAFVQNPAQDENGKKRELGIADLIVKFEQAYVAIAEKAETKGATASADEYPGVVSNTLLFASVDLDDAIDFGIDGNDKHDRRLRATLQRVSAVFLARVLGAESRHVVRPNPAAVEKVRAAATAQLLKRAEQAVARAAKKGVVYDGVPIPELAEQVAAAADLGVEQMTTPKQN